MILVKKKNPTKKKKPQHLKQNQNQLKLPIQWYLKVGITFLVLLIPTLTFFFWLVIIHFNWDWTMISTISLDHISIYWSLFKPNSFSFYFYSMWFFFQFTLYMLLPGDLIYGLPRVDSPKDPPLMYYLNGLSSFLLSIVTFGFLHVYEYCPLQKIAQHIPQILTVAFIYSLIISIYLYIRGITTSEPHYVSGNFFYDFWMGTELNPRSFSHFFTPFDFKFFFEGRVGLTLWIILNGSIAMEQYTRYGTVSVPMILINIIQFLYVFDYFYQEDALLSTMDILVDRFGFMLCFGDVAWVPFIYIFQSKFLLDSNLQLAWTSPQIIASVLCNIIGLIIFRSSNNQKHNFRFHGPKSTDKYIKTKSGSTLLYSGWWGFVRKPNYLGDLFIALSWVLTTGYSGIQAILPWFHIIYFIVLLVNRAERDHKRCLNKYGSDWITLCRHVPYKIIPYVY